MCVTLPLFHQEEAVDQNIKIITTDMHDTWVTYSSYVLTSNKIRNNNTDFLVFTQGTLSHW